MGKIISYVYKLTFKPKNQLTEIDQSILELKLTRDKIKNSMLYAPCGERSEPLIPSLANRLPQGSFAAETDTSVPVNFQHLDQHLVSFIEYVSYLLNSLMIQL